MIPLVDMHCHLLAGLDDGPRTPEDALAMCRMLHTEGVRMAAALAHQNERWHEVTPERIRSATQELSQRLHEAALELTVFPTAEVTAFPDLEGAWTTDQLLSVADRRQYLLLEMPHGLFVDLRPLVRRLREHGVRIVLAHPERQPELLHESGAIEEMIGEGCLVQVSSGSVTKPASRLDEKALRSWFRRGCVHLLGSDGHSPRRRPPQMAAAYERIRSWAGDAVADRVCSTNGLTILQGLPLQVPPPRRKVTLFGLPLW
jgi:protein-tyrosine phosphatase